MSCFISMGTRWAGEFGQRNEGRFVNGLQRSYGRLGAKDERENEVDAETSRPPVTTCPPLVFREKRADRVFPPCAHLALSDYRYTTGSRLLRLPPLILLLTDSGEKPP